LSFAVGAESWPALPPPREDLVELLLLGWKELASAVVDALSVQPNPHGALLLVLGLVVTGKFITGG